MSSDSEPFILSWPSFLRPVGAAIAVIGFSAWAIPTFTGWVIPFVPSAIGIMIMTPCGLGLLLWTFQWIEVTEQSIISHLLGIRWRLDTQTTVVTKIVSNGYKLKDASRRKLFISNWMIGNDWLVRILLERQST